MVSAGLELDFAAPLFTEPAVPTLVITGGGAPPDRVERARQAGAEVIFAGEGGNADPARIPGLLADRGLRRQLTEGGPTLLGEFADAGVLDELCLSIAPRIVAGSAPRIMNGPVLPDPDAYALEGVLEEEGFPLHPLPSVAKHCGMRRSAFVSLGRLTTAGPLGARGRRVSFRPEEERQS